MFAFFRRLMNAWRCQQEKVKEKKRPFLVDDIKVVEDLGGGKVLTRAYYKGEPVGREVILLTTKARRYFDT